jgi:ribonuclease Z
MDLSVFFAGTAGSVPTARRGLPALLLRRGGDRILVDCGEGTQRQLLATVGLPELSDVLITHFHADHWLGLPGLLRTMELRGRERPLDVHGPPGLRAVLRAVGLAVERLRYEVRAVELEPGDAVPRDGYRLVAFRVVHRGPAYGYALVEDERPGRFDPERAAALGVRPGPDFGRLQRGEAVEGVEPAQVMGPPRPGRTVVVSGDTAPCDPVALAAHRADLLVHEATFCDDEAERAAETRHSTAAQAAALARDAEVSLLALTHLSTRYSGRQVREEAQAVFPATVVPRDFDAIEIPLPERGAPELRHWEDQAPAVPA